LAVFELKKKIEKIRPDIIHCWLPHAIFTCAIATFLVDKKIKKPKIIWGIFQTNYSLSENKLLTLLVVKLCQYFSYTIPDKIITDSRKSYLVHCNKKFCSSKFIIINNGFDTNKFKFSNLHRKTWRKNLKFSQKDIVLGMVGRWDPQKNHYGFLKSISLLKDNKFIKIVLIGSGISPRNKILVEMVRENNLSTKVKLLNARNDIHKILPCFDIYISFSTGESFSNALGEAMSCELPCVVSNVGDSKFLLGKGGIVCNSLDSKNFSKSIFSILSASKKNKKKMGKLGRSRIIENFSLSRICNQYFSLYKNLTN
jgi:glycosyltransferase involved in cell wall biosynthesis